MLNFHPPDNSLKIRIKIPNELLRQGIDFQLKPNIPPTEPSKPLIDLGWSPDTDITKNRLNGKNQRTLARGRSLAYPLEPINSGQHGIVKMPLLSRAFIKFREIANYYGLDRFLELYNKPITTAHFAEGPGGFIQAIAHMRRNNPINTQDIYYGITLKTAEEHTDFVSNYLIQHPNIKVSYGADGTGNLFNSANINYFFEHDLAGKRAQIVTGDGGFEFGGREEYQEQLMHKLLFAQFIGALTVQAKGGVFICKCFDIYTQLTAKMVAMLGFFYEHVDVFKPQTSRPASSERYIIAFNFQDNIPQGFLANAYGILDAWTFNVASDGKKDFYDDLFNFAMPQHITQALADYNAQCAGIQIHAIENMLYYALTRISDEERNYIYERNRLMSEQFVLLMDPSLLSAEELPTPENSFPMALNMQAAQAPVAQQPAVQQQAIQPTLVELPMEIVEQPTILTTADNPPVVVEPVECNGRPFLVVRDDLLDGGTKTRALEFALHGIPKNTTLAYVGPTNAVGQYALTRAIKLGYRVRLFLVGRPSAVSDASIANGAEVSFISDKRDPIYHRNGADKTHRWYKYTGGGMREAYTIAEDWARRAPANAPRKLLNFGLGFPGFEEALANAIRSAWIAGEYGGNQPANNIAGSTVNGWPGRIWVAVGSGTVLKALQRAFPTTQFVAVSVSQKNLNRDGWDLRRITEYNYMTEFGIPFSQPAAELPPFPSVPSYDAKVWHLMCMYGEPGDYFWNVATEPNAGGFMPNIETPVQSVETDVIADLTPYINTVVDERYIHIPRAEWSDLTAQQKQVIMREIIGAYATGRLTFPWKRSFMSLFVADQMMNNLYGFQPRIQHIAGQYPAYIKFSAQQPNGQPLFPLSCTASIIHEQPDYFAMDAVVDIFQESARLSAHVKGSASPLDLWKSPDFIAHVLQYAIRKYGELTSQSIRDSIYENAREATQFKPSLAKAVIEYFGAQDVLDPSGGWGDRLAGAIAAGVSRYLAYDPNMELKQGHDAIIARYAPVYAPEGKFEVRYAGFQDANLGNEAFDLIFTSPPFFNYEIYSADASQSVNLFGNLMDWIVGFLFASIEKAWHNLRVGGHLALHISDVSDIRVCEPMCLLIQGFIPNSRFNGVICSVAVDASTKARPIWVFEKLAVQDAYVNLHGNPQYIRGEYARGELQRLYPEIYARMMSMLPMAVAEDVLEAESVAVSSMPPKVRLSERAKALLRKKKVASLRAGKTQMENKALTNLIKKSATTGVVKKFVNVISNIQPNVESVVGDCMATGCKQKSEPFDGYGGEIMNYCCPEGTPAAGFCRTNPDGCYETGRQADPRERDLDEIELANIQQTAEIGRRALADFKEGKVFIDPEYTPAEKEEIMRVSANPLTWMQLYLRINYGQQLPYRDIKTLYRATLPWGQRKLLMNEIYFLTEYGHLAEDVVYVGAAYGKHLLYLRELFPNHNFHLYDPMPFFEGLYGLERITIYQQFFTDDTAREWAGKKVLFISDIRIMPEGVNLEGNEDDLIEMESQVVEDMKWQKTWVQIIKPKMSMLKFRLPYGAGKTEYFKGDVYLQPWAPLKSTETRLITDGKTMHMYNNGQYERVMYYHNVITRDWQFYVLPISIREIRDFNQGFDCVCELNILHNYWVNTLEEGTPPRAIWDAVVNSSNTITALVGEKRVAWMDYERWVDYPMFTKRGQLVQEYKEAFLKTSRKKRKSVVEAPAVTKQTTATRKVVQHQTAPALPTIPVKVAKKSLSKLKPSPSPLRRISKK